MQLRLRIATRGSRLALWQANTVRAMLAERLPHYQIELVEIVSTGDVVRDRPLYEVGGMGIFTKEVQDALIDGRADLAVHSLKDLPTVSHPDLVLAAVPVRGPVADVLVSPRHATLDQLPQGATVATSSLRRRSQLRLHRPDLQLVDIRGNVETRIRKLHDGSLDGLILAEAGLDRLDLRHEITQVIPFDTMLPAVGQGALGIECRAADPDVQALLAPLDHVVTHQAVEAERAFLRVLQGGCQVPIGAHAVVDKGMLRLDGRILDQAGTRRLDGSSSGPADDARAIGEALAAELLAKGGQSLITAS